jgi:diketogulonate reductase-like aldo/keto reductase
MNNNFVLNNGVLIPNIGYGTWKSPNDETTTDAVLCAIKNGYRHIDTAAIYGNEESVGKAISLSGIDREKLFITSKVWNTNRGYNNTIKAFEESLSKLNLDYLDLYLIHWPASSSQFDNWEEINLDTWRALEKLYRDGKVKAIGVSNFRKHHLDNILENCEIKPMVNQLEIHPGFVQKELCDFCQGEEIVVEAYSPIGSGQLLKDAVLLGLSQKYSKSVAQLCIRWCLQHNTLPLPKSVTETRIIENSEIFDFKIEDEDMLIMNSIKLAEGLGTDPDKVDF